MRVRLIHPVWVVVESMTTGAMIMDPDTRQPVHGARSAAVADGTGGARIPGQVRWNKKGDPDPQVGGMRFSNDGYVIFLAKDLDKILGNGRRIKFGDRITSIGNETGLSLYVGAVDPCFHDPKVNGAHGYKCHFSDRDPNI